MSKIHLEEFLKEHIDPTFRTRWGITDEKIRDNASSLFIALGADPRTHPAYKEHVGESSSPEDHESGVGIVLEALMREYIPTLLEVDGELSKATNETMSIATHALWAFLKDSGNVNQWKDLTLIYKGSLRYYGDLMDDLEQS